MPLYLDHAAAAAYPPITLLLFLDSFLPHLLVLGLLARVGLLLALALLLAGVSGNRLLENLEDLLVLDLLVSLVLAQVESGSSTELSDTVLGDGCLPC